MRISEVLDRKGREIIRISPGHSLHEAALQMCEAGTGALLVFDGESLIGILTERDLLKTMGQHGHRSADMSVGEIMSRQLVTCNGDMDIQEAMGLMLNNSTHARIRHLPVLDEKGQVQGMISMSDLVESLLEETKYENKLLKNFIKNWDDEEESGE